MDFADLGQFLHRRLEGTQRFLGLALEADHRENSDREAQLGGIELGVIATDDPVILQRADPPQARRRGQPDPMGELDVGNPPFVLQLR